MKTIKGPAIFLAQFAGDEPPFNSLENICRWVSELGYIGVQIPSWDKRLFDLEKAAESQTYCDEVTGVVKSHGMEITELSTHLQGQLVAVHPAYDEAFDGFAAEEVRGNPKARQEWAIQQLLLAAKASKNLGLTAHATFSGALAWPFLIMASTSCRTGGTAFDELANLWTAILNAFDDAGVDVCYEIHPEKISMMVQPLRCSSTLSEIMNAVGCSLIRSLCAPMFGLPSSPGSLPRSDQGVPC